MVRLVSYYCQDYDIPPPEPLPRVFPKDEDPKLVKRNRRMLGQLLGTLEVLSSFFPFINILYFSFT